MLYSVPESEVVNVTWELRSRGRYVFVTDVSEGAYCQFGKKWAEFLEALDCKESPSDFS